jgi:hypothetical protein
MNKVPISLDDSLDIHSKMIFESESRFRRDAIPGSIKYASRNDKGVPEVMWFVCPCGCGALSSVFLNQPNSNNSWQWDNSENLPTLSPSIQKLTPCRWHGHLNKGVWESC